MSSTEPTIVCPNCKTQIKLTESLAAPLIETTRRDYEKRLADKDADLARQVRAEREKIAAEESKKARQAVGDDLENKTRELAELNAVLSQKNLKLAEAQKAQADLIRKQRELDDARREMDLTIEKKVQESLGSAREQGRKDAEEKLKLTVSEKELTISSMQKQIEDLKRRAEQGSQQLQGEVQELVLESLLKTRFPLDAIEPVAKGEFGGDAIQRVSNSSGQICGTILWESKRTKNWSDGWLTKLRDDQRTAKAEVAVLVTQALPKDVETFDLIDGVWVTHPRAAIPVAMTLRHTLIETAAARQSLAGQQTKTEMIYHYLTGPRFKQRVEAIVEAFSSMQEDLDKEKKAITKQWAKREEQITRVMNSTVGMYGDLQGIAGKSLQEIEGLDFPKLSPGIETENNP